MMHEPVTAGIGDDLEIVVFQWSRRYGECDICGLPAAYVTVTANREHLRLCCVCAARAAAEDGDTIVLLDDLNQEGDYAPGMRDL